MGQLFISLESTGSPTKQATPDGSPMYRVRCENRAEPCEADLRNLGFGLTRNCPYRDHP